MLPSVPCDSSLSQVDPKTHMVPVNMVVTSSDADVVACFNIGKSEFAIQNPKVSFVFLKPQVLNPTPTPLSGPVLINEVHNFEKTENPHADLVSTPQISSCSDMVVLKSNSVVDSGLVQQQFKHLLLDYAMVSTNLRGFSDKWGLELGDGKRVVMLMGIERPIALQSEGDGVMVEDVDLESWSESGEMVEFD